MSAHYAEGDGQRISFNGSPAGAIVAGRDGDVVVFRKRAKRASVVRTRKKLRNADPKPDRREGGVVMIFQQRKGAQATRERLRSNALLLQSILLYRRQEKSPGFGWGIERVIVDRELSELEEDIRLNPACGACEAVGIMRNVGPDSSQGRTR